MKTLLSAHTSLGFQVPTMSPPHGATVHDGPPTMLLLLLWPPQATGRTKTGTKRTATARFFMPQRSRKSSPAATNTFAHARAV